MTDIVERLRDPTPRWTDIMDDAADEIGRLRAERDWLRKALQDIAGTTMSQCLNATDMVERLHSRARAALRETGHE